MPDFEDVLLDVCLNEGRGYVQGSQMLADAARHVGGIGVRLDGAAFRTLTDRRVLLRSGTTGEIGHARFLTSQGPLEVSFAADSESAPEAILPQRCAISPIKLSAAASTAAVSFTGASDLRDLLDVAVQLTKGLHRAMTPEAKDFWFTSLRQAGLPTRLETVLDGDMQAVVTRRLSAGGRVQSLNALTVRTPAFETTGVIGFVHHRSDAPWV